MNYNKMATIIFENGLRYIDGKTTIKTKNNNLIKVPVTMLRQYIAQVLSCYGVFEFDRIELAKEFKKCYNNSDRDRSKDEDYYDYFDF